MNPLVRNILIIGTVLVLGALVGGFSLWVLPVESQIAELTRKLDESKGTRDRGKTALAALEASTSVIREQLDTLALYDLREEQDAENVLQTRSNSQLIQFSKILEDATVSVDELNLDRSESLVIAAATGGTPIASVQKQHFRLHATGFYRDFLAAFDRLKKLPPTVAVNNYTVTYLQKVGAQAKVDVTMDVSFNFLMKPVAGAAAAGGAAGGGSAFEQMMQKLGGKGGFLIDKILKIADLLVPPAYAATGRLEVSARAVRVVPDEPVGFRTFRLRDGRVVVDMPGLRVAHKQIMPVGRSGVRTARLAQFSTSPLIGRLVLDTTHGWVTPRRGPHGGVIVPLGGRPEPRMEGAEPPLAEAVRPNAAAEPRHPAGPTGQREPGRYQVASRVGLRADRTGGTPALLGHSQAPAVRATPMPTQQVASLPLAATQPAPAPEPEPIIRRIAVRPWRAGEVRRIAVQPWTDAVSQRGTQADEIRRVDVGPEDPVFILSPALAPVLVNNPTGMAVVPGRQSGTFQVVAAPPGAKPLVPPAPGGASGSTTAVGTGGALDGRKLGTGLPEVQVGRAEPFFPLFDATDDIGLAAWEARNRPAEATPSATASVTPPPVIAATPPPPAVATQPVVVAPPIPHFVPNTPAPPQRLAVTLRGVLMAGDRAYGLFDVGGQTVRATIGSSLAPGYEVKAIGRNFALVASPFGTERKVLATTWMPVINAPAFPTSGGAAAAGASPLPALP